MYAMVVILALTFAAEILLFLLWLKERRSFSKSIYRFFRVTPGELTPAHAEATIQRLAWDAGALFLLEEVLQEQIDKDILPIGVQILVENLSRRVIDLPREKMEAVGKLRQAYELCRTARIQIGITIRDEMPAIALLPPYNMADRAREETSRRRENERLKRQARRIRNR